MKNWNSKDKKYYDIKGNKVRNRAKEVVKLYSLGESVKELATKYELSESRIREYLKSDNNKQRGANNNKLKLKRLTIICFLFF